MPQLYLAVAIISLLLGKLKDIFAAIKISEEIKEIVKFVLIGLLIYCVYRIITHYVNKQNAFGDVNGALAIELNNAIYANATNFNVPFFGDYHIGDGDEAAVLAISLRIKDINEVAKYYKDLFDDRDLYTDLNKIMSPEELAQFNTNVQYNARVSGSTPPNPKDPAYPVYLPTSNNKKIAVGAAIYCKTKDLVNVRSAKDPTKILYKVNNKTTYLTAFGVGAGYVGDFVLEKVVRISGKDYPCLEIDVPWGAQTDGKALQIGLNGLIVKDFVEVR